MPLCHVLLLFHCCNMIPWLFLSQASFYIHGFIWDFVGLYKGLYKKTIISMNHFHCHSSLASNNTNITFSSRFVAFVHSTSVFIFIVTSCTSRFVAFAHSHAIAMVVSDRSVDETFVATDCCETKNCPLCFVGGECFHCKVCFQCLQPEIDSL